MGLKASVIDEVVLGFITSILTGLAGGLLNMTALLAIELLSSFKVATVRYFPEGITIVVLNDLKMNRRGVAANVGGVEI
jgi:hypothetical protein